MMKLYTHVIHKQLYICNNIYFKSIIQNLLFPVCINDAGVLYHDIIISIMSALHILLYLAYNVGLVL